MRVPSPPEGVDASGVSPCARVVGSVSPDRLFSGASIPHSSSSQPYFSFEGQVLGRPWVIVDKLPVARAGDLR